MPQRLPAIGEEVPDTLQGLPAIGEEVRQPPARPAPKEQKSVGGFLSNVVSDVGEIASDTAKFLWPVGEGGPIDSLVAGANAKRETENRAAEEIMRRRAAGQPIAQMPTRQQAGENMRGHLTAAGDTLYNDPLKMALSVAPILPGRGSQSTRFAPLRNRNAVEADAVAFGRSQGIPVDAATATGNKFVRAVQRGVDESLVGGAVSGRAQRAQIDALNATGQRLATRAHPTAIAPEQAGIAIKDAIERRAAGFDAAADTAYGQLRAFEAQQKALIARTGGVAAPPTATTKVFTDVPLAVDLGPTKAAMRSTYEELLAESKLVPLLGGKATQLTSLAKLMDAPDFAPLSVADAAASSLKAISRVDASFRRTAGQGVAAQTVKNLDGAIRDTAFRAGPQVFDALMKGRAATVNKFKSIAVLDKIKGEPVKTFNQATWAKDAGIAQLRAVAKEAPAEMKQVGRAYLDDLLSQATSKGGFDHVDAMWSKWQQLGPETKNLIFENAAHVKDLDRFFLLAKKMAENPNPSGTALAGLKWGEGGLLFTAPHIGIPTSIGAGMLSKFLHSPTGARLLTEGLTLPVKATAQRSALAARIATFVRSEGATAVPALAAEEQAP